MSSIVYYRNSKTNRTYAYEVEAKWNSEKGYSVPKRKYLGRVDPVTNEIIPSTGKPGRPTKAKPIGNDSAENVSRENELEQKLADCSRIIMELKQEISRLKKKDEQEKQTLKKISQLVDELIQ
nr:hypothetical protein [Clostridia bacterium]